MPTRRTTGRAIWRRCKFDRDDRDGCVDRPSALDRTEASHISARRESSGSQFQASRLGGYEVRGRAATPSISKTR